MIICRRLSIYIELIILLIDFDSIGQAIIKDNSKIKYKDRTVQLSLLPGLSTNGINSGYFKNTFSLNIFSGYSGGNYIFEIAGISNYNQQQVSGIQISGIANISGGNNLGSSPIEGR